MSRLSPQERCNIIKDLSRQNPLRVGKDVYAIDSNWFKQWKFSVGFTSGTPRKDVCGPIDNRDIVFGSGSLKFGKNEGEHFNVVSEAVWMRLHEWYGGGPSIKFEVIKHPSKDTNVVILYKFCISIFYRDKFEKFFTHMFKRTEDLKEEARKALNVKSPIVRLLEYSQKIFGKALRDGLTLQENGINKRTTLYLDEKEADKGWISNSTSTPIPNRSISNMVLNTLNTDGNPSKGISGIRNIGNTCYMNAGLQCLLHLSDLRNYFSKKEWRNEINKINPIGSKGAIVNAFSRMMVYLWGTNQGVLSASEIKSVIGRGSPQFHGFEQEDSHEFLSVLLDGIHEDLNRCTVKPQIETVIGDGLNDVMQSELAWKQYLMRNNSIIVDLFQGQLRSKLVCPNCMKTTVVFDPFMSLSLPINRPSSRTLTFIHVPYEFSNPTRVLNMTFQSKTPYNEISNIISREINKETNVAIGSTVTYRDTDFSFGLPQSVSHRSFFSLEYPDTSKYYVVCSVIAKLPGVFSLFKSLSGPFVVEIESFDLTIESLVSSIVLRLNHIWNGDFKLTSKSNNYVLSPLEFFENQKIRIINPKPINGKIHFEKSNIYSQIASNIVTLEINPNEPMNYQVLTTRIIQQNYQIRESDNSISVTIDDCFSNFSCQETLDGNNQWYCPSCKQFVCAEKSLSIWKSPKVLIIQLKRFINTKYNSVKLDTPVRFDLELNISPYIAGPHEPNEQKYRLVSIIEHSGGISGGHYTSKTLVQENRQDRGKWYLFNDHISTKIGKPHTNSPNAYVLFYERE